MRAPRKEQIRTLRQHHLLDVMIREFELKNDAALARFLQIFPAQVSKVRAGRLPVSADLILRIHDCTDWEIKRIKQLAGLA